MMDDTPKRIGAIEARLMALEGADSVARQRLNDLENFTAGKAETVEAVKDLRSRVADLEQQAVRFADLRAVLGTLASNGYEMKRAIAVTHDIEQSRAAREDTEKDAGAPQEARQNAPEAEALRRYGVTQGQCGAHAPASYSPTLAEAMEALREAVENQNADAPKSRAVLAAWDRERPYCAQCAKDRDTWKARAEAGDRVLEQVLLWWRAEEELSMSDIVEKIRAHLQKGTP